MHSIWASDCLAWLFSQTGALTITAPANGNVAPPGYYMLFILNTDSVPSVAKIVQVSRP
jgi:hypothetical protein